MDNEYVICPFNKNHIISRLRIQYHLVKCKRNHPHTKKLVCPYDATEYVDPNNYTNHLYQCKRKKRLDVSEEYMRKQYESIQHGDCSVQTFHIPSVEITNEWSVSSDDEDLDELTHDEFEVMKSNQERAQSLHEACSFLPVIPHPIGRGKLSHALYDYINRHKTSEEPTVSRPLIVFPHNKNDSCKSSSEENKDVEAGIYDDAEEELNETYIANNNNNGDESNYSNVLNTRDNQSVQDYSKYFRPAIGRGQSILGLRMGRGSNFGRRKPNFDSSVRPLDHILKKIVLHEMSENLLSSLKVPVDRTAIVKSENDKFSDVESLESRNCRESSECETSRISPDSLNGTLKPQQFQLNDGNICFIKPRMKTSLISSATSNHKDTKNKTELRQETEEEYFKPITSSFGRGSVLKPMLS